MASRAKRTQSSIPPVHTGMAPVELTKAQVSVPPPGGVSRYALLGPQLNNDVVRYSRRQQLAIYYEIYKQHPVVKSAIDKKADMCVAGGWDYVPEDNSIAVTSAE